MPEIWLNYGEADVVLDVRAENLEQRIDSGGDTLDDAAVSERLGQLDLSGPTEIAVLHDSHAVRRTLSSLFETCRQKSWPLPRVLADRPVLDRVREGLPEGATAAELAGDSVPGPGLVFVAEAEFDGLFGYETIATRLLRRFGGDSMLAAYAKRRGNLPAPGQPGESMEEARRFADGFEIRGIELAASSQGIINVAVGHPSQTASAAGALEAGSVREAGEHRAVIISTGKGASNGTLARSLSSVWNCAAAVRKDGLAVLVAECGAGLGSEAMRRHVEGRLSPGGLRSPARYVDGMEGLLFLSEMQKKFQVGLVSILPEMYARGLGMVPLAGIKYSLDHILRTQGARQKVTVVSDGARLLLR